MLFALAFVIFLLFRYLAFVLFLLFSFLLNVSLGLGFTVSFVVGAFLIYEMYFRASTPPLGLETSISRSSA